MNDHSPINSGAKFVRADLHIHSYGFDEGSYDVKDSQMTPENIVDTAIEKGLSIISITDHNEIGNSKNAIEYAADKNLLVIPGIEVSTTQGHLLLYFPTFGDLRNFRGKLSISDDKERCTQGIVDCLNLAEQYNGIGVLAHIDLSSGFEQTIGRYGPPMEDILIHPNLWALEICRKDQSNNFTNDDDNPDRKRLINLRKEKLNLQSQYSLPKIMSSDAHTLDKLGTNADGNNRLTRIKVDSLNFHAFKIALLSHESRVRLEDLIPEKTPRFLQIKIEGGLLDKQVVRFSSNLTCIVGGRGAGKSTLLESLRESSGNSASSKLVDSEVWPEKISLQYEDEAGQIIELTREKNAEVVNVNDPSDGITKINIESYGQGETAETIQHSDENPQVLINFLDSFVEVSALKGEEEEVRNLLMDNQSQLNKLRIEVAGIPETKKLKANLEAKVEKLKKDKVGDLVKYQTALHKEREIRKGIVDELKDLIKTYRDILSDSSVFENFESLTDDEIIVGKDNFSKVKQIVSDFSKIVKEKASELNTSLNENIEELRSEISNWAEKEKSIQKKIDDKKDELDEKGIPFDLGKINQLAKDVSYYQERLKKLQVKSKQLIELSKERTELIKKRKEVKNKIFYNRKAFADRVNDNLKNAVDGFFVTIKYDQGKHSPQFEDSIKSLMDWRTIQVPRSKYLADVLSPLEFTDFVKRKNLDSLKQIRDAEGKKIFSDGEISRILSRTIENYNYEDFESVAFEDKPSIIVTKLIKEENGDTKRVSRNLSQLSLGQQQSILLAILLQSKSKVPLIIDQPEDNLDSEFIYKTIVATLRRIKESRQVIVVTHNPNIAVLGDAELILPLKSTNMKSMIINRGSIDRHETRDLSCEILEGGKQAFISRKEIYGIT